MGWLKRLFGLEKPQNAEVNPTEAQAPAESTESVPLELICLMRGYVL